VMEPFFPATVRGCLVRIGISAARDGGQEHMLYRVAEVIAVQDVPEHPYTLGGRKTYKRLQLEFGECKQLYPMSSISNQPFEELELRSWQQVLETCNVPLLTEGQLQAKRKALERASNYSYTEEDVRRKVQEERKQAAHAGRPQQLTTRQKLLAQNGFDATNASASVEVRPSDLVARPMKFQRNVLGQVMITEDD